MVSMFGEAIRGVLLVDDDPIWMDLLAHMLTTAPGAAGIAVAKAESMKEALRHVHQRTFDVALLDLHLPDSESTATVERLCEAAPRLPIVIVTGLDDESIVRDAMRQGAQDYLIKGRFNAELLQRAVLYAIERKRMEKALRESEERFRQIAESAGEWIWEVDAEGLYTYSSSVVEEILGFTPDEIVGKKRFYDFFDLEAREELTKKIFELFARKEPFHNLVNPNIHKNGARVFLRTNARPILDQDGVLLGYRGADTDITERQRAEEQVREAESLALATIEALTAHICVLDEKGKILAVNEAWRRFARNNPPVPDDAFVGENYFSVCDKSVGLDSKEAAPFAAGLRALARGEIEEFDLEYPCHAPGDRRWFLGKATRLQDGGSPRLVVAHENITERKLAEEALQTSEELYRAVVEDQTEVITRFKPDGTYTFVSDVYCRFFGKTREELMVGKWQPDAVAEDIPEIERQLCALSQANPVVVIENRVYTGRGEVRWMQFVNRGFFDSEGRLMEIQAVGRDITERKRAEEKLRESEEQYRRLFEVETDAILLVDCKTGRFLDANAAATRLYGYSRDEFLTIKSVDVSAEAEKPARAITMGETNVPIRWHRKKDGAIFPVEVAGSYFENRGHKIHVAAIRDITERKRAEDALREAEARLSLVFHASPIAIAITRFSDHRLVDVNEAWQKVTGFTREEVIGRTTSELDSWVNPGAREWLLRELRAKGTVGDFHLQVRHKSGAVFDMLMSAERIELAGEPCMLSMAQDITDRKRAEENLRVMSKRVLDAQDDERRRIARELHDSTAQQLVAMTMNLEMLEDALPGKNRGVRKLLRDSLALAKQCAREVRTISYLLHPPLLDQLGLTPALRSYIDGFSKRSGILVTVDEEEGLGRFPTEVELALFRVVQESLANVHRHSGSRTADVRIMKTRESVTVEISDKGCGISDDVLAGIQRGAVGPGMGVAGMRERLRQLGGNLELESDSRGTTIRATAPVGKMIGDCGLGIGD